MQGLCGCLLAVRYRDLCGVAFTGDQGTTTVAAAVDLLGTHGLALDAGGLELAQRLQQPEWVSCLGESCLIEGLVAVNEGGLEWGDIDGVADW